MLKTKTKVVLKWQNKFSGEQGFVKTVSRAKGYFMNTYDPSEAKSYRSPKEIEKDLAYLSEIGELNSNNFFSETVTVPK